MSDIAAPKSSLKRKLLSTLLVASLGGGGAGYLGYGQAFQPEPLAFAPFHFRPLEETALSAKFSFLGDLTSWITGSDTAEVELDEREFNALLFGKAGHGDEEKARVHIEGEALRIEYSKRREGKEPASYVNVTALIQLSISADSTDVKLLEGHLGALPVKGPLASWVGKGIAAYFQRQRAENPRLRRLKALWIEDDSVHLVYERE